MKGLYKVFLFVIVSFLIYPISATEFNTEMFDLLIEKSNKAKNNIENTIASNFSVTEEKTENSDIYNENYNTGQDEYTFGLIPTEELDINFASHLYLDTTMLYGYPTVGVTWDMGINVDTVTISTYLRYSHFFKPLGSTTGKLAVAEEFGEAGISFKVRIYELGRFNVNLGINTSWYQQWLMLGSNIGTYNLVNNGLMIRPEASIGWNWIGWWTMEIGLFYQTPLYPSYEGYQGWGVYVKLL